MVGHPLATDPGRHREAPIRAMIRPISVELVTHRLQPTFESRPCGLVWNSQSDRDVGNRGPLKISQSDDVPIDVRQTMKDSAHLFVRSTTSQIVERRDPLHFGVREDFDVLPPLSSRLHPECLPSHDGGQPSTNRSVVPGRFPQGSKPGLLGNVVGITLIPRQSACHLVHKLRVLQEDVSRIRARYCH